MKHVFPLNKRFRQIIKLARLCDKHNIPYDMKRFMDGLLHIYDEGRTNVKIGDLLGIKQEALRRLPEKDESVAP